MGKAYGVEELEHRIMNQEETNNESTCQITKNFIL